MIQNKIFQKIYRKLDGTINPIISNQFLRYKRKGYGLFLAFLFAFLFFYYFPSLLFTYWANILSLGQYQFFNLKDEKFVYVITMGSINLFGMIIGNLFMYFVYTSKIKLFEQQRASNKPWPWEENSQQWNRFLKKNLKTISLNIVIHFLVVWIDTTSNFKFKFSIEQFPDKFTHFWQILIFMISEDFLFYASHCLFHTPFFYKYHKKHHQYNYSISLAVQYSHPIDFILSGLIPSGLGYKVLSLCCNVHHSTVMMWLVFRILETTQGHSGYEWSWSFFRLFPFSGSAEYHGFHHSNIIGNYGSFTSIWDTIFGTNKQYFIHKENLDKQLNGQQQQVNGQYNKKIN